MKRILAILLASLMVFTLFGCQSKEVTDNKDAAEETQGSNVTGTTEDTTPEETIPEEEVLINGMSEAKLSLYNPNAPEDTSLVAIVGYHPFRTGGAVGTSKIMTESTVCVVDFEEEIKNKLYYEPYQYAVLESLAIVYQLGVGNEKYSIVNVRTDTIFNESWAKCYLLEAPPEKFKDMCAGFIIDQYNCNGHKSTKGYQSESNVNGEGWYAYTSSSGLTDKVCIKINETEKSDYYISLNLNEKVDQNVETIGQKINNKEFRDSVIFLKDINDFNSKTTIYGKDVDLKNTVFYQDAIATKVSYECGLNLRNKDYFFCSDAACMIWDLYDSQGYRLWVTYKPIERPYNHSKYEDYYNSTENRIERVIGDDTYVYVNPNGGSTVYTFKNGTCTGKFVVEDKTHNKRTTYESLNVIFGLKPVK